MSKYHRVDVSEGIDINKINASNKIRYLSLLSFFSYKGFQYEPYLCNGFHDLMQKAVNFNDVVIVFINASDYRIYFWNMSKNDAINIIKNFYLNEKRWIVINFLLYIKLNDRTNYYQRNRERILNRAKNIIKATRKY